MKKGIQVLDNKTELYQLYGWFPIGSDKKRCWYLFAQGTKEAMFWVTKVHIEMMASFIKDSVAFMGHLACYLVLSPRNEIIKIPPLYEIQPWKSDLELSEATIHNMKLLDDLTRNFKDATVIYEGRVKVKEK